MGRYYLQSRGLPPGEAKKLMLQAFVAGVFDGAEDEARLQELALAKDSIARSLPGLFETTASTANSIGSLFIYGLPLDYYRDFPEKVDAVSVLVESSAGVAMVGDGVNDAPAMAASTLGIAMGAIGTDVAIETADVVLMSDDIDKIDYVIHLGKRARRVVRQNVYFSIGWMLFLVVIALTVGIPLPLAVVGHEGSTLLVAANGLRLLAGKPHPPLVPAARRRSVLRRSRTPAGV